MRRTEGWLCRLALAVPILFLFVAQAPAQDANSQPSLSLSLKEAVELALKQSPQVQAARFRSYQAKSETDQIRSAELPQITMRTTAARITTNFRALGLNFPGVPAVTGPLTVLDARPRLEQSIFNLNLHEEIRAAGKRAAAQRWDEQDTGEATALAVVNSYLQILESDRQIASARARLDTATSLLRQVQDLLTSGVASKLDQARAEGRLASEQAFLTELLGQRNIGIFELNQLLGNPPEVPLTLTDQLLPLSDSDDSVTPSGNISDQIEKRASTKALEATISALDADKRATNASNYPTVNVAADYGYLGNTFDNPAGTYTVQATLNIPIYLGGKLSAEKRMAQEKIQEAGEQLRAERLRAQTEIDSAKTALDVSKQAYKSSKKASEAATTALDLARSRFEGGLSTNIDVISAQQVLAEAQASEIEYLYEYYIARAKLARAQGNVMSIFQ